MLLLLALCAAAAFAQDNESDHKAPVMACHFTYDALVKDKPESVCEFIPSLELCLRSAAEGAPAPVKSLAGIIYSSAKARSGCLSPSVVCHAHTLRLFH
jgi:hypothetical protein